MATCEFCEHQFSSGSNMYAHQKTAKYCLTIQNDQKGKTTVSTEFRCEACNKVFRSSFNLQRHASTCVAIKIANKRDLLQKQVKMLKKKLTNQRKTFEKQICKREVQLAEANATIKDLAARAIDRPTTQNNQTNNKQVINLAPFELTEEKAKAIFDAEYNESYFLDGPKGLARFVNNHILKTEKGETIYACFDASRCVFKYKNEDGSYIKDIKAKKLVEIIYPSALAHGDLLAAKFTDEYFNLVRTEEDFDAVKTAEVRSNLATDSFLTTRRLKDEPEPFANELASLTAR
jgi:hypothetical protein